MKKMSRGEQLKLLKDGRKKLRDLSIKGRMAAQDTQEQDTQEQILKRATRISVYERYIR